MYRATYAANGGGRMEDEDAAVGARIGNIKSAAGLCGTRIPTQTQGVRSRE